MALLEPETIPLAAPLNCLYSALAEPELVPELETPGSWLVRTAGGRWGSRFFVGLLMGIEHATRARARDVRAMRRMVAG
jgi:hypothetical protein